MALVKQATTRVEDGCVSKNFGNRAYANKLPQEVSVGRFLTPFV